MPQNWLSRRQRQQFLLLTDSANAHTNTNSNLNPQRRCKRLCHIKLHSGRTTVPCRLSDTLHAFAGSGCAVSQLNSNSTASYALIYKFDLGYIQFYAQIELSQLLRYGHICPFHCCQTGHKNRLLAKFETSLESQRSLLYALSTLPTGYKHNEMSVKNFCMAAYIHTHIFANANMS